MSAPATPAASLGSGCGPHLAFSGLTGPLSCLPSARSRRWSWEKPDPLGKLSSASAVLDGTCCKPRRRPLGSLSKMKARVLDRSACFWVVQPSPLISVTVVSEKRSPTPRPPPPALSSHLSVGFLIREVSCKWVWSPLGPPTGLCHGALSSPQSPNVLGAWQEVAQRIPAEFRCVDLEGHKTRIYEAFSLEFYF